jgi:membrane protease YdiL (CAAX protease family)
VSEAVLAIFSLFFFFLVASLLIEKTFPGIEGVQRSLIGIIYVFLIETVVCVFLLIVIYERSGRLGETLGIKGKRGINEFWAGVFCFFIFLPVIFLSGKFVELIENLWGARLPRQPIVELLENIRTPERLGLVIFMGVVFAPVAEELLFRVFLYGALRKQYGPRPAMMGSAFIFSVVHFNNFALLPIFILGLILAYIYEKRQSILAPVALHMAHNSLQFLVFFVFRRALSLL